jgi:hypothetical protein
MVARALVWELRRVTMALEAAALMLLVATQAAQAPQPVVRDNHRL